MNKIYKRKMTSKKLMSILGIFAGFGVMFALLPAVISFGATTETETDTVTANVKAAITLEKGTDTGAFGDITPDVESFLGGDQRFLKVVTNNTNGYAVTVASNSTNTYMEEPSSSQILNVTTGGTTPGWGFGTCATTCAASSDLSFVAVGATGSGTSVFSKASPSAVGGDTKYYGYRILVPTTQTVGTYTRGLVYTAAVTS
jgi:hypothetical protein